MSYVVTLVVLSAAAYRVSRFLVLDTLIDEPRSWVLDKLERKPGLFYAKLTDLIGCPYCITIWVAGATVAVHHFFIDNMPVPIWTWLAVATGSLVVWGAVDSEEKRPR